MLTFHWFIQHNHVFKNAHKFCIYCVYNSKIQPNGRFGHALAVLDLDQNGCQDLVVSAPAQGSPFLEYTVSIYWTRPYVSQDVCLRFICLIVACLILCDVMNSLVFSLQGAIYAFFSTRNADKCTLQTTAGLTQTCTVRPLMVCRLLHSHVVCLSVCLRETPNIQKFNKVCKLYGVTCAGWVTKICFFSKRTAIWAGHLPLVTSTMTAMMT